MGKLLILEDEESINRGISFSLAKADHEICSCYTIQDAKVQALSFHPEVVICDISLPDGNGLDYIAWLRQQRNVYIICLTGFDQEMDQVMGYEAGADDYITKPFSLSVLLLKIEAYFKRSARDADMRELHSGGLCVSQKEMKLYMQGQEVSLTKNEWRLLTLFLLHPKQILSKEQMLEALFDRDEKFVDVNTLAVNIRRLREKIEKDPGNPEYIKNVRGLGYVWNLDVK